MWVKSLIGSMRPFVHRRRQHMRRHAGDLQRVAVRRRAGDRLGADQAAAAGAVLDEELLAEGLAELVGEHAAEQVVGAAGRIGDDDAHRLVRPFGLRRRGRASQGQWRRWQALRGAWRLSRTDFLLESIIAHPAMPSHAGQTRRGDYCVAAFMPSTLAMAASLSCSSLMPAANSGRPAQVDHLAGGLQLGGDRRIARDRSAHVGGDLLAQRERHPARPENAADAFHLQRRDSRPRARSERPARSARAGGRSPPAP